MKKRVLSMLLCLCMVLMLCPVTAFAERGKTVSFTVTADKTEAQPGDTINFTLTMGAVDGLGSLWLDLRIPEGLTFVEGSGTVTEGLEETMSAGKGITFNSFLLFWIPECNYTSTADTVLMTFQCTVNDDATTGAKTVGVGLYDDDEEYCFDVDHYIIDPSFTPATVTVSEASAPTLAITIDGPDVVCAQQDYKFTATPPAGVTLDETFGHDSGFSGSDIELTIDEDGVGHGVVPAAYYVPAANGFDVNVHGTTAGGTKITTTKHVEVSPEHIYEDGVCGCGAVKTYTVEYIGGGDDPICMDTKTHGEPLTLRGETFKMDGYVQTGWVDGQGAVYDLGAAYTEDRDATLNPVFEKLVTLTVPYTTTVALGDAGEPGETTFDLTLIDGWGKALTADHMTVTAGVTTGGAGDYTAAMTITGPERTLWRLLSEGAFVRQVNAGEDGWTVDDTVWGVLMEEIPVAYAMGDDATASGYTVYVVPVSIDEFGNYEIDWESIDWQDPQSADMCFTNTYSAHVYELNYDADGHWDECGGCKDKQNEEPHQYGEWTVTKEATEKEAGEKEHTCTVCGYQETAEIAKLSGTDTTKPDTDTKKTEKTETDSVQTGDNSNPTLWLALLGVSAAGVIGTGVYSKRKKGAREK